MICFDLEWAFKLRGSWILDVRFPPLISPEAPSYVTAQHDAPEPYRPRIVVAPPNIVREYSTRCSSTK